MVISNYTEGMSEPEKEVYSFLTSGLMLKAIYEHPVFLTDEVGRPRVWTPDFYLPMLGMYVEVIGSKKLAEKEHGYDYRKKIFHLNSIPIIFLKYYETSHTDQNGKKKDIPLKWTIELIGDLLWRHDMREEYVRNVLLKNIKTMMPNFPDTLRDEHIAEFKEVREATMWKQKSHIQEMEKKRAAEKAAKIVEELAGKETADVAKTDSKKHGEEDKADKDKDAD